MCCFFSFFSPPPVERQRSPLCVCAFLGLASFCAKGALTPATPAGDPAGSPASEEGVCRATGHRLCVQGHTASNNCARRQTSRSLHHPLITPEVGARVWLLARVWLRQCVSAHESTNHERLHATQFGQSPW
jgi:hypothetical protein